MLGVAVGLTLQSAACCVREPGVSLAGNSLNPNIAPHSGVRDTGQLVSSLALQAPSVAVDLAPQSVARCVMEVRRQVHVKASLSFYFYFHLQALVSQSIWACRVWRAACGRRAWAPQHPGLEFLISCSVHVSHPGTGRGSGFGTPIGGALRNGSQLHVKASPSYHFYFSLTGSGCRCRSGPAECGALRAGGGRGLHSILDFRF